MKKLKKLLTMLMAFAAMLMLPGSFVLTASAEGATTYYMRYEPEKEEWFMVLESEKDDENAPLKSLDAFYQLAKDGDVVVVVNNDPDTPVLDLRSLHLSNLTVYGSAFSMITVGSIDEFHALADSKCSVTGTIDRAYIHNPALANFNSDVQYIEVIVEDNESCTSTVGCGGTVRQMKVSYGDSSYSMYSFDKGTLSFQDGTLETSEENFSMNAPAATPAPAPQAPQTPAGGSGSSGEYDSVPKTGDSNVTAWLLCAAALCMAASICAKKAVR